MRLWADPQHTFTLFITQRDARAAAHKHAKYKKIKGLQSKIILFCRIYKYKNVIHVIIDSHCVYQN